MSSSNRETPEFTFEVENSLPPGLLDEATRGFMIQSRRLAQVAVTLWERAKIGRGLQSLCRRAETQGDNSIRLIKCSLTFAAWVPFLVSRGSGFSSVESWSLRVPIEGLLTLLFRPNFFFSQEEEAEKANSWFCTEDERTLERVLESGGGSSTARHGCVGLTNPYFVNLRLTSHKVPAMRFFWNLFTGTFSVCTGNAKTA